MRISLQWLSEWLEGPAPAPRDLAARLTMAGLEIEGIEAAAPPLPGVVVGEIVERNKHPNADTLSVCQVNTGTETVQIVCGAPNARAGMKAPLAVVGARLPGGMEIKKAKLRGVESFGMLCSARELGLSEESSGLLDLPAELATGAPIVEALRLDDTILEVNLTPNRGDCMSVLGVAREVAALTGTKLTGPVLAPVLAASQHVFVHAWASPHHAGLPELLRAMIGGDFLATVQVNAVASVISMNRIKSRSGGARPPEGT